MAVEFKTVEAIGSLVALLRVAENSAVHCWEQEEPFDPGIFPGLILLARFAAERAGEEFKQAIMAAEKNRLNTNLQGERDELRWQLAQVTAERDAARQQHLIECRKYNAEVERRLALEKQVAELTKKVGELPAEPAPEPYQWKVGDVVEHDDGSMSCTRPVTNRSEGWVFLLGDDSGLPQSEWERRGWKLFRKASDLGMQQLTPRQVEISDSTDTDGEGQS